MNKINGLAIELRKSYSIAGGYGKAGQKEKAAKLLTQVIEKGNPAHDDAVSFLIAIGYANADQLSQAIETAKTIKDPQWKLKALVQIAAEAKQKDEAVALLSQALEIAKSLVGQNKSSVCRSGAIGVCRRSSRLS